jgi:hypothetical protein
VNRVAAAVLNFGPIPRSVLFENDSEFPNSLVEFNNYVRYENYAGVPAFDRSMPLYLIAEPEPHWLLLISSVVLVQRRRRYIP